MKILYVCNEDRATTKQRLMALKDMDIDTDIIYYSLLNEKISIYTRIIRAVKFRLGYFPERNSENFAILSTVKKKSMIYFL